MLLLAAYGGFLGSRGEDYSGTRTAAKWLATLYEQTGDAANAALFRVAAGEDPG